MYQGKYPDGGLPPGYHGVAYSAEAEHICKPPFSPSDANCEKCGDNDCPTVCGEVSDICADIAEVPDKRSGRSSALDRIFSHKPDLEDLLLRALRILLLFSGENTELVLMLAILFVMGL